MKINQVFTSNIRRTASGYALRGLVNIAVSVIGILLSSCSTETIMLRSRFLTDSTQTIKLGGDVYARGKGYGNYFVIGSVKGEVQPINGLVYQKGKGSFTKEFPNLLFTIPISMYKKNIQEKDLSIKDISGEITLKSGRKISPYRTRYGYGNVCHDQYLKELEYKELEILISSPPNKTCIEFQYQEFISPESEFEINVAKINDGKKINFSFMPMVSVTHSH